MNWDWLDEMPYRKATKKKAPTKLDHQHDWQKVLVYNPAEGHYLNYTGRDYHYRITTRCAICGRVVAGGDLYAKEGEWYYPILSHSSPIYRLRDNYDCYIIDHPVRRPAKDATYTLAFTKKRT